MAQQQVTTQRYGAKITTVDPTQGLVEAVMKDGTKVNVSVYTIPTAFRWPRVGENWIIYQQNGSWYLEGYWPANDNFKGVDPGDAVITTPTGVVRVTKDDTTGEDYVLQPLGALLLNPSIVEITGQFNFPYIGGANFIATNDTVRFTLHMAGNKLGGNGYRILVVVGQNGGNANKPLINGMGVTGSTFYFIAAPGAHVVSSLTNNAGGGPIIAMLGGATEEFQTAGGTYDQDGLTPGAEYTVQLWAIPISYFIENLPGVGVTSYMDSSSDLHTVIASNGIASVEVITTPQPIGWTAGFFLDGTAPVVGRPLGRQYLDLLALPGGSVSTDVACSLTNDYGVVANGAAGTASILNVHSKTYEGFSNGTTTVVSTGFVAGDVGRTIGGIGWGGGVTISSVVPGLEAVVSSAPIPGEYMQFVLPPCVLATVTVGDPVISCCINPAGTIAYVGTTTGKVYPITLSTHTLGSPITVGGASDHITGLAVSHDANTLWCANLTGNALQPVKIATSTVGVSVFVPAPKRVKSSPNNTMWTGGSANGKLYNFTQAGVVTSYPTTAAGIQDISVSTAAEGNFPVGGGSIWWCGNGFGSLQVDTGAVWYPQEITGVNTMCVSKDGGEYAWFNVASGVGCAMGGAWAFNLAGGNRQGGLLTLTADGASAT